MSDERVPYDSRIWGRIKKVWDAERRILEERRLQKQDEALTPEQRAIKENFLAGLEEVEKSLGVHVEVDKVDEVIYRGNGIFFAGNQNIRLDRAEEIVIETLIEARALSKDELITRSGVDDAVRILKRIKKKHPAIGKAIVLPGGKGRGGYSTSIKMAGQ